MTHNVQTARARKKFLFSKTTEIKYLEDILIEISQRMVPFSHIILSSSYQETHCIVRTYSYIHGYMFLVDYSLWFSWTICIYIIWEGYQKIQIPGLLPTSNKSNSQTECQRIYIFNKPSQHYYKFHEELCVLLIDLH